MKRFSLVAAVILLVSAVVLGLAGCGESRQPYAGVYRSLEPYAGKGHVELEFKEDGEGTWKMAQEGITVKFKWRVEKGRIWVYTKEGAIIHVTPAEGGRLLTVDMTGQWHDSCPVEKCLNFERVKGGGS
ncbi:MAG: hypothetical protein ACUVXF_05000 [Desulfobaccales bacterium]